MSFSPAQPDLGKLLVCVGFASQEFSLTVTSKALAVFFQAVLCSGLITWNDGLASDCAAVPEGLA